MKTIEYLANTAFTIELKAFALSKKLGINYEPFSIPDIITPARYFADGFLEQWQGENLRELIRIGVLTTACYAGIS